MNNNNSLLFKRQNMKDENEKDEFQRFKSIEKNIEQR